MLYLLQLITYVSVIYNCCIFVHITFSSSLAIVSGFSVIKINDTTVHATWQPIDDSRLKCYTIYYMTTYDIGSRIFPVGTTEGVVRGLNGSTHYLFSLSVTFLIHDIEYEGERTVYISPIDIIPTTYITSTIKPLSGKYMTYIK